MATITPSNTVTRAGDRRVMVTSWASLGDADTGSPVSFPHYPDKTVQVSGSFNGSTVLLRGSNDGTNYYTLTDPQGNALSFTAEGLKGVSENPLYIQVETSGGTAADTTVTVVSSCRVNQ